MKKTFILYLKRLTKNKAGMVLCILSPVIILLCFAAYIAPVYFDTEAGLEVLLLCEDKDPLTLSVVKSLVETEKSRYVIQLTQVSSTDEGLKRIQDGAVCLIHIPDGFQKNLLSGGQSTITFYKNAIKPLQSAIVSDVLSSGIRLVNEAQKDANTLYDVIAEKAGNLKAQQVYNSASKSYFLEALNKNAVFVTQTVSPLGALQPVEYYAASLLVVFLSLCSLSLYTQNASDYHNGIISRELAAGYSILSITLPRILSGAAFIFLQGLPILLLYLPVCFSSFAYGGSVYLMPVSLAALSIFISAFAYGISGIIKENVKAVFFVLALLLILGGAIIPVSFFGVFSQAAIFTPFSMTLRTVHDSFFFYHNGSFLEAFLFTLLYTLLFAAVGIARTRRKA